MAYVGYFSHFVFVFAFVFVIVITGASVDSTCHELSEYVLLIKIFSAGGRREVFQEVLADLKTRFSTPIGSLTTFSATSPAMHHNPSAPSPTDHHHWQYIITGSASTPSVHQHRDKHRRTPTNT